VNQGRPPDRRDVGNVETATSGGIHRQHRNAGRVHHEVRRDEIAEVAHGTKGRVDRFAFQERVRPRFAGQRLVPRRSRVDGNESGRVISEGRDHVGIERVPRTTADHRCCTVGTTEHPLKGGVSGHVNNPHRQRYLIAPHTTWVTFAVPTLGDVCEQAAHRRMDAEPVGEHRGHLAKRSDLMLEDPGEPWKAAGELPGTRDRRAAWWRHRTEEAGCHFCPRREPARSGIRRERVVGAEQLRGDVGVCGAPDVEQLTRVVGLGCRRRINVQAIGQPHREQRAVQAVLQRHADAEVRRK
jgi:hypothetical protein